MTKRIIRIATVYILGVALLTAFLYISNRYIFPDSEIRSIWSYVLQSVIVLAVAWICVFAYNRITRKKRSLSESGQKPD